jgi:hypothetical protein
MSLIYIKNSRGTGRQYIAILIENDMNCHGTDLRVVII